MAPKKEKPSIAGQKDIRAFFGGQSRAVSNQGLASSQPGASCAAPAAPGSVPTARAAPSSVQPPLSAAVGKVPDGKAGRPPPVSSSVAASKAASQRRSCATNSAGHGPEAAAAGGAIAWSRASQPPQLSKAATICAVRIKQEADLIAQGEALAWEQQQQQQEQGQEGPIRRTWSRMGRAHADVV